MKTLLAAIMTWFSNLKGRLFATQTGSKPSERDPLTKFSIVIILLLDLFLFGLIYDGISKQSMVVDTPESYASYRCRNTMENFQRLDMSMYQTAVVEDLYRQSSYSKNISGYNYDYGYDSSMAESSLECANLRVLLTKTDSNSALQTLYRTRNQLQTDISTNENQTSALKNGYDTKLLEKIAGQPDNLTVEPGTAATTKANLERLAQEKLALDAKLAANTQAILADSQVKEIANIVNTTGPTVLAKYDRLVFWYPVKTFAVEVLFLIPLLLVVAFWSNRSLMRGRPYQLLMASHMLAILGIFIVLKLMEFVYDIIPHKLINMIIDWLTSIQLVGIWYYLMIFLSVSAALGIVYFIQRRVKIAAENRKAEIGAKRAEKGDCWSCGAHLPMGARNCIRCGIEQYTECQSCKHSTFKAGEHCMHCGKSV